MAFWRGRSGAAGGTGAAGAARSWLSYWTTVEWLATASTVRSNQRVVVAEGCFTIGDSVLFNYSMNSIFCLSVYFRFSVSEFISYSTVKYIFLFKRRACPVCSYQMSKRTLNHCNNY